MIRRPPRSTRTDTPFPTRRSSDLFYFVALVLLRHLRDNVGHPNFKVNQRHCAMAPRLIASREACMKTRLSLIIAIVAMFSLPAQASAALAIGSQAPDFTTNGALAGRSEEHTSALQSLMRISYAVLCLKHK